MNRGVSGRYEETVVGGETIASFIPHSLPPEPSLEMDSGLQHLLETASLSLGRLDSVSTLLPETGLFLYTYLRKEAVLSSQIEGTQSSLSDLLLFEFEQAPGVPLVDVQEVSNYVSALEHGIHRLRGGFPVSSRLIREIHEVLLRKGRGSDKEPGEFRRSQNWVGGTRPGNAKFVPPPHTEVAACIADLEKFIHAEEEKFPVLLQAGLAHVQFETIHPFLDGNGRVGRLLITLLLCAKDVLRDPLLYLSLYFKQHREEYYALLDLVRKEGDWERWLRFFLTGVAETADGAVATARRLVDLFEEDKLKVQNSGRNSGSVLRILEALRERPLTPLTDVSQRAGLSFPAAGTAMQRLVDMDIVRELTGKKRNRIFVYDKYLAVLSQGTE
jgi:Fic family protein